MKSDLSYFNGEINRKVYQKIDAVDFVKTTHKEGGIDKLFKVPQNIYNS